jgi:hypothetical protein
MAKLRHPHIVPVFAIGEGHGLAYLIMPRIVGEDLRARIAREGPLPAIEVHRISCELASALEAAHAAGVIHRDLKPDNVLLEGDEQRALLSDFGIARRTAEVGGALTMAGVLLGTPHYMSPEQAAGEPEIGPPSDIYSLGVVAYEMLTGRTPFRSDSVLGLLTQQLREDAPSPSDLRADCPPDLASVVSRCLVREPEERWESASALLGALTSGEAPAAQRGERGLPVAARRAHGVATTTEVDPRRRFRWAAALALGVSLSAFALDGMLDQQIDFAPFVAAAAILFVLLEYGLVIAALRVGDEARSATSSHSPLVQRAATERAVIVSIAARVASAERAELADVLPAVDRAVARAASLADRVEALDRAIAAARRRLERGPGLGDADVGGRELGSTIANREHRATREAESSRIALEAELEQCVAAIQEVRLVLGRDGAAAAEQCLDRLSEALPAPDRRARE